MSTSIEMDDLSRLHQRQRSSAEHLHDGDDDDDDDDHAGTGQRTDGSIPVWAWTSAAVLALFSICLLAFPRFLLFLAEPSGRRATLTALEEYLAFYLGVILGTLAVAIIAVLPNEWPTGLRARPSCHPLLKPVTAASVLMALLSYDNRSVGTLATAVLLGSSIVGVLGLWTLVFSGPTIISRKTGADKRTSAFIFGNKSAASVKRRLWKRDKSK